MLTAFLGLIGCQLAGELIRAATLVPIPGPLIGMFLLAALLALRSEKVAGPIPPALDRTAETLIRLMGLLFVPAGVGIITDGDLLRREWLPILAGLIGSTLLSIAVTGLIMHWAMLPRRAAKTPARLFRYLAGFRHG
jgi:putative effector of murein hydrolase LrgA (UPF0299 family)